MESVNDNRSADKDKLSPDAIQVWFNINIFARLIYELKKYMHIERRTIDKRIGTYIIKGQQITKLQFNKLIV